MAITYEAPPPCFVGELPHAFEEQLEFGLERLLDQLACALADEFGQGIVDE